MQNRRSAVEKGRSSGLTMSNLSPNLTVERLPNVEIRINSASISRNVAN